MEKVAIISGGMGGVGKAAATALATARYRVVLLYHASPQADVDAFIASLSGTGHAAFACNLADEASTRQLITKIAEDFGRIDVLVHAATERIARASIESMDTQSFREQFEVSLFGAFTLFSSVLHIMKAQKSGLIVGITTSFIETGAQTSRMPGYVSSKFALRGLLRELAREAQPSGIRVNAVAPDLLQTTLSNDLPARYFEWAAQADPRGRLTTTDEVAERIMFLLSPEGESLTGKSLFVYPVATSDL